MQLSIKMAQSDLERKQQMSRTVAADWFARMLARPDVANKYTFHKAVFINMTTKITITCVFHNHDFDMQPDEFARERFKCPWCNLRMKPQKCIGKGKNAVIVRPGPTKPQRWVVERVWGGLIKYDKYVYRGGKLLVTLICETHDNFEYTQPANEHHRGVMVCPDCIAENGGDRFCFTRLQNVYPELYAQMNVPDPLQTHYISKMDEMPIVWKCKDDPTHIFTRPLGQMMHEDSSCHTCRNNSLLINHSPAIARQWDTIKNVGIDVNTILVSDTTVVYWKCEQYPNKNHEFEYSVYDRIVNKRTCDTCNCNKLSDRNRLSLIYPLIAAQWHPNNELTPADVMYGTRKRAKWICESGHVWTTVVKYRTLGHSGCPQCSRRGFSLQAIEWLEYVMKRDHIEIKHAGNGGEVKIMNTAYSADGYCEATHTVYEFHGDYWHGNLSKFATDAVRARGGLTYGELYRRTLAREQLIRDLGYNLVVIWQNKFEMLKRSGFSLSPLLVETRYDRSATINTDNIALLDEDFDDGIDTTVVNLSPDPSMSAAAAAPE